MCSPPPLKSAPGRPTHCSALALLSLTSVFWELAHIHTHVLVIPPGDSRLFHGAQIYSTSPLGWTAGLFPIFCCEKACCGENLCAMSLCCTGTDSRRCGIAQYASPGA